MTNKPSKREMTGTSVTIKALIIFALVLLMLIPKVMIQGLIRERQERSEETIAAINAKWSGDQTLCGPIISVPATYNYYDSDNDLRTRSCTLNIAPDELNVTTTLYPEPRHYGIYETVLYKSKVEISGVFEMPNFSHGHGSRVRWVDAQVKLGLSDLRGITDSFEFTLGDKTYPVEAGTYDRYLGSTLIVWLDTPDPFVPGKRVPFHCSFNLNGSSEIDFIPIGQQTKVRVESEWPSPSFVGSFSADHTIGEEGFVAEWSVLHFNRDIPAYWIDNEADSFWGTSFGVRLFSGVDHYQQNMRSAKYALMFIGLTFVVFFFVEILTRRRIHPIQYLLVGLALILFYTLLLSLSEQIGFGYSYLIASVATIGLITAYAYSVFKSVPQTVILALLLSLLYVYLYVVLQLEDIALLIGSIGLFVILGVIMYVSRKINWYKPDAVPADTAEKTISKK